MNLRRLSLWLSLVPLVVGAGLYWLAWRGWADDFGAVMRTWFPGNTVAVAGFPYRMETEITAPALANVGPVTLSAKAARARINRGPWRPELTLVQAQSPQIIVGLDTAVRAVLTAPSALASVHVLDGRLERLSVSASDAAIALGFTAMTIRTGTFEVHVREQKPGAANTESPRLPIRGQMVLSGTGVRLGKGAPLVLAMEASAHGPARLIDYARWQAGGSIEVGSAVLSDPVGEVARAVATLVPGGAAANSANGAAAPLRLAGTIDTVCPASIAAAIAGTPPLSELRLRVPVRLSFEGSIGPGVALRLAGMPANLAARPRRGQLPACPRIR
ncbi:DUF2125 domain-containing protein [Sandarakinorhabdus sp.]|uniref:DUF2125 domain-containing protein n=1 Tax=Sandarakinorhabdus sp. TaxID=1916663 RepID=UPI00286E8CF1|nr:DUF2125 domain-containing protein [Sandarakinorhabdus sp.]